MLDEVKFLRELPVLHGKIEMPDYKGVCIGVYLICEKGMGFISVFCTNERKENAIFGYDVLRNKGTFLSLHQIEILNCKIGKEQDSELHFNKGVAFDDIHDVVERNKDNLKDKGIIAIKGTKIFYDVYADMVSMSIKMIINENEYVIDEIVGVLFEDFSCKFTIHEMQLDEKIQKVSLQTDIELIINIAGIEYREKGIIFKIDKSNKQYTLKLMSYPMYMLGHMVINNLVFQNIRNPFVIIKYMLESVDIDINGVAVPNEMKAERTFLVAMAINNLKLLNGSCSVGDVRIGEEIKVSSEFEELLEKGGADERVIIWTDQRATNHYEAYSLAKEKLMRVVDLVAFFAKNDCLAEYFGIGDIYVSLRDEHNKHEEKVVSHYQIYNQCVEHECSRNHFYGWSITYEKMKQYVKNDLDNGDKLILDTAKYVLENDEFKKMSDISEKMGKIAVKLSDAIICSKYDDDDVKDLLKIMKVKNAVMDLQMAVERSGLKVFLLKNAQFLSMNDEYELELRKSNYVPYIGEHKPELCNKGMNDIFIDLVDRMMFVQYMMLMGIFEGFWDILIELSKEDGVEGNLSQPNGIRRGSFIHKNIGKEIVNKEAWMYKIHDDKDSFYFLANKRIIHIEKNEGKSEVYGIAYPKEDIGLFEKEIVTE